MNRAQRFLSIILMGGRYTDALETLGANKAEAWGALMCGTGDITVWPDEGWCNHGTIRADSGVSFVRLAHFDCDWENFVLAQVWDHGVPSSVQRWEWVLLFNTARNSWVPEIVAAWQERPTLAEAASVVDGWTHG